MTTRPQLFFPVGVLMLVFAAAGNLVPASALGAGAARPVSPEHAGNAMDPQWAPDGKSLAYEVSYSQQKYTELFMLVPGGREEKLRPPSGASGLGSRFTDRRQVAHEFAWAPGGQLYAFASSGVDDDFDIYLRGVSVAIGSEQKEGGASFSSDGRLLSYCSAGSGDGDLYLLDIYALEKPAKRLTFGAGLDFYGVWSPKGARVAFVSHSEGGANIVVIDDVKRPREATRALTNWNSNQLKPSWSPDAAWIAFYSNHGRDDRTRFDAYLVQSAGGEPFVVARDVLPSERRGPTWSPDGKELILVKNEPNAGDPLIRVTVASRTERVIETGTVNNSEPSVSSDDVSGTWKLAFVSQGKRGSESNAWRRVWVYDLPREAPDP